MYELATIISYSTSMSGIKNNNFQQTGTVTIFGEHSIMAHIP